MSNLLKHASSVLGGLAVVILVIAVLAIPSQTAWADDPPPCPCLPHESAQECAQRLGVQNMQQFAQQYGTLCQWGGGGAASPFYPCIFAGCPNTFPPCAGNNCEILSASYPQCPCFIGTLLPVCFCK